MHLAMAILLALLDSLEHLLLGILLIFSHASEGRNLGHVRKHLLSSADTKIEQKLKLTLFNPPTPFSKGDWSHD